MRGSRAAVRAIAGMLAAGLLVSGCNHINHNANLGNPGSAEAPPQSPAPAAAAASSTATVQQPRGGAAGFQSAAPLRTLAPAASNVEITPPSQLKPKKTKVVVALLLPLTGKSAQLGTAMRRAGDIAFFDLAGADLVLQYHDTKGEPAAAAEAAKAAIDDGADLVIGPVFAQSVQAAAGILSAANVPTLAFSNAAAVAKDGIFILGAQPDQQIDRLIRHVAAKGLRTIGIFAPDNSYGQLIVTAAENTAAASGLQITKVAFFQPGDPDAADLIRRFADYDVRRSALTAERQALTAQNDRISTLSLQRLAALDSLGDPPYEALLLPIGGNELRRLAPHFPFFDVDPSRIRYLGTALWSDPTLGNEPALVGGWFAAPNPASQADLNAKFTAAFGTPAPVLAALTFDAVALAALLQTRDQNGSYFDRDGLTQPSGYTGATGLFRLLPNGQNQRGLAIMQVGPNGLTVIDPEPQSFDQAVN